MMRKTAFLLVLTALVFWRVPSSDFVNLDDPSHLDNNPHFTPLTFSNVLELWKEPHLLYMPMTYTLWGAIAAISPREIPKGTNPTSLTGVPRHFKFEAFAFHLVSLLLHLLSCALIFLILKELVLNEWAALFGASLFAIHPIQAEVLGWISATKDTLSSLFLFSAVFIFLKYREKKWAYWGLVPLLQLLALLSKPNTVILPFILFVLAVFTQRRSSKRVLIQLAPCFLLSLPFGLLVSKIQATHLLSYTPPSFELRPIVALDAIGFYLRKLFIPIDLAVDYGRTPEVALQSQDLILNSFVAILTLSTLTYFFVRKRQRLAIAGLMIFLLSLLPVLGFKPFSFQTTSTVSDRYLYVPMFGVCLILAFFVSRILHDTRAKIALGGMVLLLCSMTYRQSQVWKDTFALLKHTIRVNPQSWLSYNNLASFHERYDRYDLAVEYYEKAASIKPMGIFYNNLGAIHLSLQQYDRAIHDYQRALQLNPLSSIDLNGLGFAYLGKNEKKKAREAFEAALRINPYLMQSRFGLEKVATSLEKSQKQRPQSSQIQ